MNVAMVVFGSVGLSSSGRRSLHFGSSLILLSSSSYLSRPCWERKFESFMSLVDDRLSLSDSSSMLCHVPSLMTVKNSSRLMLIELLSLVGLGYFSVEER